MWITGVQVTSCATPPVSIAMELKIVFSVFGYCEQSVIGGSSFFPASELENASSTCAQNFSSAMSETVRLESG